MYRKEEIEIITDSGRFHAQSVTDAVEHVQKAFVRYKHKEEFRASIMLHSADGPELLAEFSTGEWYFH
jgi:hypothetical protein